MNKQTRKEKKAEEVRVLAEMKAALEEAERAEKEASGEAESASAPKWESPAPQEPTYHCHRCKTVMQKGVCPVCGFKMYVPMDEKKLGKIKLVLTAIGMAIFIAIFLYIQMKKS